MTPLNAERPPQPRLGIGLMCLGILLFAVNDVLGKWLLATYSVGQVLLMRSLAALLILSPFIMREGLGRIIRAPQPAIQLARVAFGMLETASFYWAVTSLPLANVMTCYLSAPLYVAAVSPFLLRERLSKGQILAVVAGFAGALLVLKPSSDTLLLPTAVALLGSMSFAGLILSTRHLRGTSATSLIVWQIAGALVFGAVLVPFGWVTPSPRDIGLLSLLGIVAMLGHMLVAQSLRLAPAAVVSPFQYTLIVWAILFGWMFFGEWPDAWMIAGAVVIVASGLYLLWREARSSAIRETPC